MTASLMKHDEAEELAATLNASDEDGWTYTAVHPDNIGLSRVSVSDETGSFVDYL